ncbi:MAG: Fe-S-containing protein [Acidobacteriota bacterium]
MTRFKPIYGLFLVLLFMGAVLTADFAMNGGFGHTGFERVSPDQNGTVRIPIGDLGPLEVRFYRFLNYGNQEVKFLVGRDGEGILQVAFDASETDYKRKRGFRHEGEWLVNNKCDTACRLSEVNGGGGGCAPVPMEHTVVGNDLVLQETDVLAGWRYFR